MMKHFKWDEIPAERLNDKFVRKLAWDGKMMVARTDVEQGYHVPAHSHDNEQITWVMSGTWRFRLEGKTVDVGPNEMISIPANVVHSAEAIETPIGYLPADGALSLDGLDLSAEARDKLFGFEREGWRAEFESIGEYLDGYGPRMPQALKDEQQRIAATLA